MAGKKEKVEESVEQTLSVAEAIGDEDAAAKLAAQGKKVVVEGMLADATQTEPSIPKNEELEKLLTAAEERGEAKALEKYQGIQRTISKKDTEIERLKNQLGEPQPSGTRRTLTALLEEMEKRGEEYGSDPSSQGRISQLKSELAREEQLEYQKGVARKVRSELDQKIRDAGRDPSDEMFESVNEAFEDAADWHGKFDRAERKLDRILTQAKPMELPKVEPPEDRQKAINEAARQMLEEKGQLVSETGGPSASSGSFQQFEKDYIEGKVPPEEYAERARREGKNI